MPSATATITGRIGAGDSLTAQAFADVVSVTYDVEHSVLVIVQTRQRTTHIDFSTIATSTVTITGTGSTKSTVFVATV